MKRTHLIGATLLLLVLILGCGLIWAFSHSLSLSTGICLRTQRGECLFIVDNSPIVLSDRIGEDTPFSSLTTGDRLLVLHDGIQETYPARTGVYSVCKTGSGSAADIPQQVIDSLAELGWYVEGIAPTETIYTVDSLADYAVSWANYDGSAAILMGGLNREKMYISSVQHLPIFKFETLQELESFKSSITAHHDITQGYDEIPSFSAVTAHMDEAYFEEYTLLLVYVQAPSCSYRYGINHIWQSGGNLCVHVQKANDPADGDCAMAGWFITAALEKSALNGVSSFDADLNNLQD